MKKKIDAFLDWFKDNLPYVIIMVFIIGLSITLMWSKVVIVIKSGETGVLYQLFLGGTVTHKVYPEGVHLIPPWNVMTIYTTRIQIVTHEFNVLTNTGLPVTLKIAARYRPVIELLGVLHQEVGPDYPHKIILPQIESVLRKGLGVRSAEDIYTNKDRLLNNLVAEAIEEVGRKFVIVDEIIIRSVELPGEIKKAIEEKLVEEQKHLAYQFILKKADQEAERKRKEAKGIVDYHTIILKNPTNEEILRLEGIKATQALAASENTKVVIIGSGEDGLPIILGGQ